MKTEMHHSLTEVVLEHFVARCTVLAGIGAAVINHRFTSFASPTLGAVTVEVIEFVLTNSTV